MKPYLLIQVDCDSRLALSMHYENKIVTETTRDAFYDVLYDIVSMLHQYKLKSTFFVVGKDLEDLTKVNLLKRAMEYGGEIGNHTYHHPNALSKINICQVRTEVELTNSIVFDKLGVWPRGFRAPNFDITPNILNVLREEGLYYDCSALQTPWKPLFRLIKGMNPFTSTYLGTSRFIYADSVSKDSSSIHNYTTINDIVEIPVTTFPYIKFPCNISYMLALPTTISRHYFEMLVHHHVMMEKPLILIFHLSDFVENCFLYKTESKYYKSLSQRLFFIEKIFQTLSEQFESITTLEYVNLLKEKKI